MRGNEKVIDRLNLALSDELTAIVQYMTQSEMCQNWGYTKVAEFTKARAIQEMRHAEALIERIIFLDATPVVGVGLKPQLGKNVLEQMQINLKDEQNAVVEYNDSSRICQEVGDNGSRELFEKLLNDEEHHVDFLESQLHAIEEMGIANYLAQQVEK